jgi:hypothetical protein
MPLRQLYALNVNLYSTIRWHVVSFGLDVVELYSCTNLVLSTAFLLTFSCLPPRQQLLFS